MRIFYLVMVCFFPDKYQLIGTLMSECSCHSNVNYAAAAPAAVATTGTPATEGITAAAPPSTSSSGICVLV